MRPFFLLVLAFLRRDLLRVRPWAWIAEWFNSGVLVVFWYFLTRFVQAPVLLGSGSSVDYFTFSLIGLALSQYMWRGFSVFVNRVRTEQFSGSMESLWVTAYPFSKLIVLSGLWVFLTSTIDAGIILAMGKLGFGAHLSWGGIFRILGVGFLTSWAMGALGLLSASWIIASGRGDVFRFLLNQVTPILSGAFFPVSLFPAWLRGMAWCFPLTHALTISRGTLFLRNRGGSMQQAWMALVGITLVLSLAGWTALRLAVRRARVNGRIASSL